MTETATAYEPRYAKAHVDALRAEDKATIERLTKDLWASQAENARAAESMKKMQGELIRLEDALRGQAADTLAPCAVAKDTGSKLQKIIAEQSCTITATGVERDGLRHDKAHLEYRLEQATARLEEYKKRVEMAAKCLEENANLWPDPPLEVGIALSVLTEKDLRRECEDCGYPCDVKGEYCLLCGHVQPNEAAGPGIEDAVATECNRSRA